MKRINKTGGERGYPRPQLVRDDFINLNGPWEFALDVDGEFTLSDKVNFDQTIIVPFAPETPASGVEETGFFKACWYTRTFPTPELDDDQRLILHFGAVDYSARVFLNGRLVVEHEGGYTPFSADITDYLLNADEQTVAVHVLDDSSDLSKPRGKQDWLLEPHSIWYMRTTGIWQTVWMERVSRTRISELRWNANLENWTLDLLVRLTGPARASLQLAVKLTHRDRVLVEDRYSVVGNEIQRQIGLPDPGIDDSRHHLLWQPSNPTLIDAEIQLIDPIDSAVIDSVRSYTAMRSVGTLGNRFMLNGRPQYLRLVLDQGYWQPSGLTAPDDEALKRDVELVKEMGFNGVRKHQKIEDPRFLYWADRLGLFVWEEMPSAYSFDDKTMLRVTRQWTEAIERDRNHPCIITWLPINESWGVPDLPQDSAQRNFVKALYYLTKSLDPSRPISSNDGWEVLKTDLIGIHDYNGVPERLAERYSAEPASLANLFKNVRPAGRVLLIDDLPFDAMPILLSEFGGIAFSREKGSWGYTRAGSATDFAAKYGHLLATVRAIPIFAGYCYTQFTDTYQEANGLFYMDRTPKFPMEQITVATRGPQSAKDRQLETQWRDRVFAMRKQEHEKI